MSDRLEIPAGEHGMVRVFTIDLELDEAETLMDHDAAGLKDLTGATALDADHIDLFDLNDLGGMPLADYLAEGHGIPQDEMAPHRAQLDRVKGRVIVIRSSAFEGIGQSLKVAAPLRWLATFGEAREEVPLEKPRSEAATPAAASPSAAVVPPSGSMPKPGLIIALVVIGLALALLLMLL